MRIIITGSPGTGKTTIAKELATLLDCEVIHVNELIKKENLYSKIENGEYLADMHKLKAELEMMLRKNERIIVESHLLCDLKVACDLVVVLRCEPRELEERLEKRGYSATKVRENVLSEVLDYCQIKAIAHYGEGKVMQIETTKEVGAKMVLDKIREFKATKKSDKVSWLSKISDKELKRFSHDFRAETGFSV